MQAIRYALIFSLLVISNQSTLWAIDPPVDPVDLKIYNVEQSLHWNQAGRYCEPQSAYQLSLNAGRQAIAALRDITDEHRVCIVQSNLRRDYFVRVYTLCLQGIVRAVNYFSRQRISITQELQQEIHNLVSSDVQSPHITFLSSFYPDLTSADRPMQAVRNRVSEAMFGGSKL